MTRPLGNSPARSKAKSSQLELNNQASLIDMGAEDDSLLSGKRIVSPQGASGTSPLRRPGASPFKVSTLRTLACIQEDVPQTDESQGVQINEPQDVLPSLSKDALLLTKKKKKGGFNLRKSLAWNNAFFTEEGVLDPEELSLVNRTFKKQPEAPKLPSSKKSAFASKILNSSGISKINFSPVRFQKPPLYSDSKHHTAPPIQGSPLSSVGNIMKRIDQQNAGARGFQRTRPLGGPSLSRDRDDPVNQVNMGKLAIPIRVDSQGLNKHTPLSVPTKKHIEENERISKASAVHGDTQFNLLQKAHNVLKPPRNKPKQSENLSSTLSSASRIMKDRLGMVFAGDHADNAKKGRRPTAEDDTVVPSHTKPEYSDGAKLARCYSNTQYERVGRFAVPMATEPTAGTISGAITTLKTKSSNLPSDANVTGNLSCYERYGRSTVTRSTEPAGRAVNFASTRLESKNSNSQGSFNVRIPPSSNAFCSSSQPEDKQKGFCSSFPRPPEVSGHCSQPKASEPKSSNTGSSNMLLMRAKPSGLRMPSPKLGFFDKAKTSNTAQISVLRERTNGGFGYEGAPSPLVRYDGTAALPVDPRKQDASPSVIPGASSKGVSCQIPVEMGIKHPVKQNSLERHFSSSQNLSQPQWEHSNAATESPHVATSEFHYSDNKSSMGSQIENCQREHLSWPSSDASPGMVSASLPSKESTSPSSDTNSILQVKKNVQNVLPTMKRIVNKLSLSPLRTTQLENLPLEKLQIETMKQCSAENAKLFSKSDAGAACTMACDTEMQEKWPEEKSGAVQHSPRNKEPPKCGPWSPVRRNVAELGPFDCTKYNNPVTLQ